MGLLSWLFPSPEDRVRRAERFLEQGRPDEARMELLGVEHPEAPAVMLQAETELAKTNLATALEYAQAGDDDRVRIHLELADQFHHGGLEEDFRETRRELRELRQARDEAAQRAKEEEQRRLMSVDPLGLGGGPSWLDAAPEGDPLAPDREEIEQRLALMVENYPAELRETVRDLGADFARAVFTLEEGRPDQALQDLLALPDDAALVQWERARAAHALGDPAAAARALRAFGKHADGHHSMGRLHSGVYLAQLTFESGDAPGALRVLRDVRATHPKEGEVLFAQLLLVTGALEEAEGVTRELVRKHPKSMSLYGLLARVRLAGGHRTEAMRALEAGMEATHCAPGKCGHQPPDLDANRLLATLYLEDGIETARGLELAELAASLVQRPTVDDVYLRALAAHARGEPQASGMAEQLAASLPDSDPRRAKVLALAS